MGEGGGRGWEGRKALLRSRAPAVHLLPQSMASQCNDALQREGAWHTHTVTTSSTKDLLTTHILSSWRQQPVLFAGERDGGGGTTTTTETTAILMPGLLLVAVVLLVLLCLAAGGRSWWWSPPPSSSSPPPPTHAGRKATTPS